MFFEKPDRRLRAGETGSQVPPEGPEASLGEVFSAEHNSMRKAWNVNSQFVAKEEAYNKRIKAISEATGETRDNPMNELDVAPGGAREQRETEFQAWLEETAKKHPNKVRVIRPDLSVSDEAGQISKQAEERAADVYARSGRGAFAASLAGGFVGSLSDPLNLASLALGPFGRVGTGASQVMWQAIKTGAINAGVEVASAPVVKDWRNKAGLEFTAGQFAQHTGLAFLFGFGLDGGVRASSRGVNRLLGREPVLDANGKVTGFKKPTDAAEPPPVRGPAPPPEVALDRVARDEPEDSVLRRAQEGDRAAQEQLIEELGIGDDPAVRGARNSAETEGGLDDLAAPLVSEMESANRMLQAVRNAADPELEPPAGRGHVTPPRKQDVPHDGEAAPLGTYSVEGKPVGLETINPDNVTSDPSVFQFKGGADAAGVTDRMAGVTKWDPIAAGRTVVFEKADGTRVIADGHQRLSLAQRLRSEGQEGIDLQSFVFREKDGWTPQDVRALAAKKNLQEGSGSVVDAAKIMRERPDIIDSSVPLSSDAMRQARSLTRLADDAFDQVVNGSIPANHAAMVGDLVPDKSRHVGMLNEMIQAAPASAREARFLVNDLMQAPVHNESQLTLLGALNVSRPLLRERSKVAAQAINALKADKRIFGMLAKESGRIEEAGNKLAKNANVSAKLEAETVATMIEELSTTRGPVSDWLNDAAREVAQGRAIARAAEGFATRVRNALEADGVKGLSAAEPESLRAAGFDDATGADARAQADGLEQGLNLESKVDDGPAIFQETDIMDPADIYMPIRRDVSVQQKLADIKKLTDENEPQLAKIIKDIDKTLGTESSAPNRKNLSGIAAKVERPDTKAWKPWFEIEHVRDTLRFQTGFDSFDKIPKAMDKLLEAGYRIVEADYSRMIRNPTPLGWRMVSFDLRAPNGQLVEFQAASKRMLAIKEDQHLTFEKWRVTSEAEREARKFEYLADQEASRTAYQEAFEADLRDMGFKSDTEASASVAKAEASLRGSVEKLVSKSVIDRDFASPDQLPAASRAAVKKASPDSSFQTTSARPDDLSSTAQLSFIEDPSIKNIGDELKTVKKSDAIGVIIKGCKVV